MISLVIFISFLLPFFICFYVDRHHATLWDSFSRLLLLLLLDPKLDSYAHYVDTRSREVAEVGGKQWCILCMALLVALGTGVGVGLPLALRSGSSLQERLIAAQNILAQVPLIDG
jgi:hypothetical protein